MDSKRKNRGSSPSEALGGPIFDALLSQILHMFEHEGDLKEANCEQVRLATNQGECSQAIDVISDGRQSPGERIPGSPYFLLRDRWWLGFVSVTKDGTQLLGVVRGYFCVTAELMGASPRAHRMKWRPNPSIPHMSLITTCNAACERSASCVCSKTTDTDVLYVNYGSEIPFLASHRPQNAASTSHFAIQVASRGSLVLAGALLLAYSQKFYQTGS